MRKIFLCVMMFFLFLGNVMALEVNGATEVQLTQLKGIGAKTATLIVKERQRAGPFVSVEDFSIRVKGMGKKKVKKLLQQGLLINGESAFSGGKHDEKGKGELKHNETKTTVVQKNLSQKVTHSSQYSKKSLHEFEGVAEGKLMYVRPRQALLP